MTRNWLLGWVMILGAGLQALAWAQQPDAVVDPRAELATHLPGAKAEDLRPAAIKGMYEYTRGTDIAYVTADGKYAINGDLFDIAADNNLTETRRRELRTQMLAAFPESQMLIFGPKDAKYTISVFTDVDCAYCRKLHSQMADYNKLGIRVRYLMYPRTGPDTPSWTKAEQVWCSPDRNDALTHAKLGEELKAKACPDNPVAHTYQLGKDFGLSGTPYIVLPNGEVLSGYEPPDVMIKNLQDAGKETTAKR